MLSEARHAVADVRWTAAHLYLQSQCDSLIINFSNVNTVYVGFNPANAVRR